MRRISLAIALTGAVAAAGCGGSVSGTKTGGDQAGSSGTFQVTIQNGQDGNTVLAIKGGYVVSTPAGIDCGTAGHTACVASFPKDTAVTLSATAAGTDPAFSLPYQFLGWAGSCQGEGACVLDGNADKYVVVMFAGKRTGHPNFSAAAVHGPKYNDYASNAAGALQCDDCHGSKLEGVGIALSCGTCHPNPGASGTGSPLVLGGHFDATKEPWGSHGTGWGQSCQRCHTSDGFRDYVGAITAPGEATATADYLAGTFLSTNTLTTPPGAAGYANGPLKCETCHNSVTDPLKTGITQVMFPSSATAKFTTDKSSAICAQCHQGRESTTSINTAAAPAAGLDAQINATSGISFKNPHYLGAAGTLFGGDAQMWAQYPKMVYTARNQHGGVASCTFCHDAHSGQLPADADVASKCGECHFNESTGEAVVSLLELEEARQFGFEGDIDGDGNATEPLKAEIDGLAAKTYSAMQVYATNVADLAICYSDAYPYFYGDTNGNGTCGDAGDATAVPAVAADGAFKKFTPRLLRAAFNYKWYKAEPGAWAHNPRYAIEILYDALFDLNAGIRADATAPIGTPVDTTGVRRSFNGHFGAAGFAIEPYAQFLYHPAAGSPFGTPGSGFTGSTCYQCHGGQGGYEAYLTVAPVPARTTSDCIGAAPCAVATGGQPDATLTPGTFLTFQNRATGMQCTTCHQPLAADATFTRMRASTDLFVPPQKGDVGTNGVVKFAAADLPPSFSMCGTCHTGLENMASVDAKIAGMADPAAFTAGFVNGHYFGAAGIILGTDAKVLYEYSGKTYPGKPVNWSTDASGPHGSPHGARCIGCHNPQASKHSFEIDEATTVPNGLEKVYPTTDWAQNTRACNDCHAGQYSLAPPKANLQQLGADLLSAIKTYAGASAGGAICYTPDSYPYFLKDLDGNGACNDAELSRTNGYKFDAKLLRAAYNYQWFVKDPGAAEHNYPYIGSVLFDAIEDLGGATTVVRP